MFFAGQLTSGVHGHSRHGMHVWFSYVLHVDGNVPALGLEGRREDKVSSMEETVAILLGMSVDTSRERTKFGGG